MKQLTQNELTLVSGGSPVFAILPTLAVAIAEGPFSNTVTIVGLFSIGFVALASYYETDIGFGGIVGGTLGYVVDSLKFM